MNRRRLDMDVIRMRLVFKDQITYIELPDNTITIGRTDENTVKIDSKKVSRMHAKIDKTPEGYKIMDLDSANGTFVNTIRISSSILAKNDVIKIGDAFIYVDEGPGAGTASEAEVKPVPVAAKLELKKKNPP